MAHKAWARGNRNAGGNGREVEKELLLKGALSKGLCETLVWPNARGHKGWAKRAHTGGKVKRGEYRRGIETSNRTELKGLLLWN